MASRSMLNWFLIISAVWHFHSPSQQNEKGRSFFFCVSIVFLIKVHKSLREFTDLLQRTQGHITIEVLVLIFDM